MHPAHLILSAAGLRVQSVQPVSGGDINVACRVITDAGVFFLKYNDACRYPGMLAAEASALEMLGNTSTLPVPRVIHSGIAGDYQYLLMEWISGSAAQADFWEKMGEGLAAMHRHSRPQFGWPEDNYIGSLPQINKAYDNWGWFYAECRIWPLVSLLVRRGDMHAGMLQLTELLCTRLPQLFPPEKPALLHGDLWSGNYIVGANGHPVLIDPALYAGHREMDLGMTRLFGGFDPRFYEAYQAAWPLEPGWQERMPLTQLYPLLVHALLFGGHYNRQAAAVIRQFV